MKIKAAFLVGVAMLACVVAAPAFASAINPLTLENLSDLNLAELGQDKELASAFSAWKDATIIGDQIEAFTEASRISTRMSEIGTRNLVSFADVAVIAGSESLDKGDTNAALIAAQSATSFAPDYPKAHFFLAKARFMANKGDVQGIAQAVQQGVKALVEDSILLRLLISEMTRFGYFAILMTAFLVFVARMLSTHRALFAEIASFVPAANATLQQVILGFLVLLAPFAVGGWVVFLLALPVLLWPYLKRVGRFMAIALVVTVAFTPNIIDYIANGQVLSSADTYRALYSLTRNTWDYQALAIIEKAESQSPGDKTLAVALGMMHAKRGAFTRSHQAFEAALTRNEKDLRALINKGNAYFYEKKFRESAEMYLKAVEASPTSAVAHYNLSSVYFEMYKTEASQAEFGEAQKNDPKVTSALIEQSERGFNYKVGELPIDTADLARFENVFPEQTAILSNTIWLEYFGGISRQILQSIAGGFGLMLIISFSVWGKKIAHQSCASCGVAFRPPMATTEAPRCNQCVAANLRTTGVSSVKRDKKRSEMRAYAEGRVAKASLLDRILPGAGVIFHNESVGGLILSFFTSIFVVIGVLAIVEEISGGFTLSPDMLMRHVIFLVFAVIYWILMNTVFKVGLEE